MNDRALLVHLRQQLARRFKDRWVALTALVTTRKLHDSWRRYPGSMTADDTGWLGIRTLRTVLSRRLNAELDNTQPNWPGFWSDLLGAEVLKVHEYHFVKTAQ